MVKAIQGLVFIMASVFMMMGLRWWFDPAGSAAEFGMTLSTGVGLSTEIGDISSLFITGSLCMFLGLFKGDVRWFYAPTLLVVFAAIGRTVAWAFHDASLALSFILPEVMFALINLGAIRLLDKETT
ncbi:MAG: hypothetical protein ACPF9H_10020 [Aequoribacter sp.]|uniref:hypothetical protein n=1 Tax=Aequoribacter sp. TaxID=2847771 RepID=UPI003C451ABC